MSTRQALANARKLIKDNQLHDGRSIPIQAGLILDSANISWRVRPASDGGILLGVFEWAHDQDLRNGCARWLPL